MDLVTLDRVPESRTKRTSRRSRFFDALSEPAGYVDSMNRYEFEEDNPANRLDPTGMDTEEGQPPGELPRESGAPVPPTIVEPNGDIVNTQTGMITPGPDPAVIQIDPAKYPEAVQHLDETGQLDTPLTVDRAGAEARRAANMKGEAKIAGKDLDESPPAVFAESVDADVRAINRSQNRGAGASMGNQLRSVRDGCKVILKAAALSILALFGLKKPANGAAIPLVPPTPPPVPPLGNGSGTSNTGSGGGGGGGRLGGPLRIKQV